MPKKFPPEFKRGVARRGDLTVAEVAATGVDDCFSRVAPSSRARRLDLEPHDLA